MAVQARKWVCKIRNKKQFNINERCSTRSFTLQQPNLCCWGRGEDFPLDLTAYANWHWSFAEQNTSLFWLHLQLHFPPPPHFLDPPKCRQKLDDSRQNEAMNPSFSVLHFQQYHQKWWAKYENIPTPGRSYHHQHSHKSTSLSQVRVKDIFCWIWSHQGRELSRNHHAHTRTDFLVHRCSSSFPRKMGGFGFGWSGGPNEFTF